VIKRLLLSAAVFGFVSVATMEIAAAQQPPTAGNVVTSKDQIEKIVTGWSAKKDILGKDIINDASPPQTLGSVYDLIIDKDTGVAYAIVEVGGFLGMGEKYILVDVSKFNAPIAGKFVVLGVTKDMVKALPEFKYAK
jgi:hypothetical protein